MRSSMATYDGIASRDDDTTSRDKEYRGSQWDITRAQYGGPRSMGKGNAVQQSHHKRGREAPRGRDMST